MKYNVLTYLIGEGFSNVFKNKKRAMSSIVMMCITMLIFGIFFVMGQNLNHFVKEVESEQGIRVFMDTDATEEQISKLNEDLLAIDGVNTVKFMSKADAFQQIKNQFADVDRGDLLEGRNEKIFPVSYIVTFTDISKVSKIKDEITKLENVDEITSSDKTINTLAKIAKGVRIGTFVILACLVTFCVFIITNTIRLTVNIRKREISIMKYVGATNSFIRWPFAVEGIIIGLISGGVSVAILSSIYSLAAGNETFIKFLSNLKLTLLDFSDMISLIVIVYLILGIGIGVLGSTISMRKYLKV